MLDHDDVITDGLTFSDLFDQYYARVYKYACYRCTDPTTAEDLTESVFVQLLRSFRSYSSAKGPFEAWLFVIARNRISDYFRKQRLHKLLHWDGLEDIPSSDDSPEEKIMHSALRQQLQTAIKKLSPRERDIIGLRFSTNLNYSQIAHITGLTESNVGVIIYRALLKLRQEFIITG